MDQWTVTYLVSTPAPDGPVDRDLPGQHTSTRRTDLPGQHTSTSDLPGQHTSTRWTVTYLVSTPVPDGPRGLSQQEAQPGHVVVVHVPQHAEGLAVGPVARRVDHDGRHVGRHRLRVLVQQTLESAHLLET